MMERGGGAVRAQRDGQYHPANAVLIACILLVGAYAMLGVFADLWLRLLTPFPVTDDFRIYYDAFLAAVDGRDPYQPYTINKSFLYHPAALTFVGLFSLAGDFVTSRAWWSLLSALAYAASIVVAWRATRSLRDAEGDRERRLGLWVFLIAALCWAPFWETMRIGQINAYVALCLYLSLYWSPNRPWAAGLALALAVAFKLSPILFLVYFAIAGQRRTAVAALVWLASVTTFAAIQFSPSIVPSYLAILPRLSSELHATVYNQSALGTTVRFLEHIGRYDLVPQIALAQTIAFVSLLAVLVFSARAGGRSMGRSTRVFLFSALVVASVVFSPLVWHHHSIILLFPIAVLLSHSSPAYVVTALVVLLLIQANRAFEYAILQAPIPVVLAHTLLLGASVVAYLHARIGELQAEPANLTVWPSRSLPAGVREETAAAAG